MRKLGCPALRIACLGQAGTAAERGAAFPDSNMTGDGKSTTAGSIAVLVFAVFSMSTAIIFLKLSKISPASVSGFRLLGAALVLTPVFFRKAIEHGGAFSFRELRRCMLPGAALALHFISWVVGLRLTFSANATLAVTMVPVVLPFFLYFLLGERILRAEVLGTVVATAGIAVMSAGDYEVGPETFKGDFICMLSMLLLAAYYALGRLHMPRFPSTWLYVVPMYYIAGAICLAGAVVLDSKIVWPSGLEWVWVGGLVLVPTVIGHSGLNWALKRLRGQVVGILGQTQFIFAGLLAFWIFGETPPAMFYLAGILVVVGSVVALRARES